MGSTFATSHAINDVYVRALDWPRSVGTVVSAIAAESELAWLDSSGDRASNSVVAFDPVGVLTFDPERGAVLNSGSGQRRRSDPWTLWRELTRELPAVESNRFGPGWIGYIGYEIGRTLERNRVPTVGRSPLPWLRMALFDRVVVLSPGAKTVKLVCSPALREAFGRDAADLDAYVDRWNAMAALDATMIHHAETAKLIEQTQRGRIAKRCGRAKEYIAAGDIYQVNLAQEFKLGPIDDPTAAYLAIRRSNPSPCGALLKWDGGAVASVSPECFLNLDGRQVRTSPIKGTRPRTGDAGRDAAARDELLASEKDAAELAMIVDLHRNDLGRVCEWGSVKVRSARRVEEHPTVIHTVADIDGTLAPGRDALDLLRACFPAGSVTGVPKIRAMEIIAELERSSRGVYTGAIGWLGLNGDLSMSVAIRTLQIRDGIGTLHAGGGIVADSDPDAEYDETLAKSRGILRALGVIV